MTLKIAMTGLRAATADLTSTSNNIANAATNGFKRSTVNFGDVFSAGSGSGTLGMGVQITDTSQQFAQGNITATDNQMDLSIVGDGFFRMNDDGATIYTRNGTFGVNSEGFIVNGGGHILTGFPADENGDLEPELGDLQVDATDTPPRATTEIDIKMNLNTATSPPILADFDVSDPDTYSNASSTAVFDSLGTSHLSTMYFRKVTPNNWTVHTFVNNQEVSPLGGDALEFSETGALLTVNGDPNPKITTNVFTPDDGSAEMSIEIKLAKITQFSSQTGVNELSQDGFPAGRLNGIEIDDNGFIFGRYSNEQLSLHGQIALTNFRNPQGLTSTDATSWLKTFASGEAINGEPGSGSLGLIQSSTLEDSNVDITEELVKIIGTQRNFQANAQVISASDAMTQTILNIR